MSETTFAAWAEPMARKLSESRRAIEEVVRAMPAEAWSRTSEYEGWTIKDQLAHLPESHRGLHSVLQAIVAGRDPDFSRFLKIDEINETNRQRHLSTPVDDLLADFSKMSQETERHISELGAEHAEVRLGPMTLSQALEGFAMHDTAHLEEMRKALRE